MVGLIFGKVGIILGKKFSIVPPRVGRAGIRAHPRKTKAGLVEKKKEKKKKEEKKGRNSINDVFLLSLFRFSIASDSPRF